MPIVVVLLKIFNKLKFISTRSFNRGLENESFGEYTNQWVEIAIIGMRNILPSKSG